jgi:DMSO/TMAO reductase YedYZ molybdopterin-dependent catalytic subunit
VTAAVRWGDVGVGAAAGVAAVAGSFVAAGASAAFVAVPISGVLAQVAPGALVTVAITRLGDAGQPLAFVGALALAAALLGAVALAADRLASGGRVPAWVVAGLAVAAASLLLTAAPGPSAVAGAAAAVTVGVARWRGRLSGPTSARRRFLRAAAAAVATSGVAGVLWARGVTEARGTDDPDPDPEAAALLDVAADRGLGVPGIEPLVSENFYQVDINSVDPDVAPEDWTLSVTGAVEEETTYDFESLVAMPAEHRFVTLRCVGDPLNGEKMDTALWTGVPVDLLLEEAGVPDTCCVMLRAADDYYEEFPLSALRGGLLAYRMNGLPLPRGHGRPVRALVPGHWGEVNVKWLTEIEVLDSPATGYWEEKGWHGTGPVNTVAKLHDVETRGGTVRLAGHAYAGTRGISRVEVSTDGGETWREATLSAPLPGTTPAGESPSGGEAADAWRQWRLEYAADGRHEAVVRAVEADGTVQPSEQSRAYPSGATGWVRREVRP